jgi:hypothetical protein
MVRLARFEKRPGSPGLEFIAKTSDAANVMPTAVPVKKLRLDIKTFSSGIFTAPL